jgi:hypothetical protein
MRGSLLEEAIVSEMLKLREAVPDDHDPRCETSAEAMGSDGGVEGPRLGESAASSARSGLLATRLSTL